MCGRISKRVFYVEVIHSKKLKSGWRNSIDWLAYYINTSVGCSRSNGTCSTYWSSTSSTNSFCCNCMFFVCSTKNHKIITDTYQGGPFSEW